MNLAGVEKIANAVLYEGYLLYPYRLSAVKNRQRFNFGVLYPREFCSDAGPDACEMRTECLVCGVPSATIEAMVRFLQLVESEQGQEGRERDVSVAATIDSLTVRPSCRRFNFGDAVAGELELAASQISDQVYRVTLVIRNSAVLGVSPVDRDAVLLRSMVSVHSVLHVTDAEFVSLLDPPEPFRTASEGCRNVGAWPVLVGDEGQRDTMLSSPIILYDYPQIAPESAGDLFDGTEIYSRTGLSSIL
jgi:hypothetical protein